MQNPINDIDRADLAKLHSEVNQFRNHEFLICSFALALVGSTVSALSQSPLTGLAILFVLFGLYVWLLTIMDSRSRVTTFLRASRNSYWENRYRKFADTPDLGKFFTWGQRNAATVIFVVLGLVIPLIAFRDGFEACLPPRQDCFPLWHWIGIFVVVEALYLGFIIYFGPPRNYSKRLNHYMSRWRTVLREESTEVTILPEDVLMNQLEGFSMDAPTRGSHIGLLEFIEAYHCSSIYSVMRALRSLYSLEGSGKIRLICESNSQEKMSRMVILRAG